MTTHTRPRVLQRTNRFSLAKILLCLILLPILAFATDCVVRPPELVRNILRERSERLARVEKESIRRQDAMDAPIPKIGGRQVSEDELRIIGPATEAAEISFLILFQDQRFMDPTQTHMTEYRNLQHYYFRNRYWLWKSELADDFGAQGATLDSRNFTSRKGGKVECSFKSDSVQKRLDELRQFLAKFPNPEMKRMYKDERVKIKKLQESLADEASTREAISKEASKHWLDRAKTFAYIRMWTATTLTFPLIVFVLFVIILFGVIGRE